MSWGVAIVCAAWTVCLLAKLLSPFDLRRPSPPPPDWAWDTAYDAQLAPSAWIHWWFTGWTRRPRVRITWRQLLRVPTPGYSGPVCWLGAAVLTAALYVSEGAAGLVRHRDASAVDLGLLGAGLLLVGVTVAFLRRPVGGEERSCAYAVVPGGYDRPQVDAYLRSIDTRNDVELAFVRFRHQPFGYSPDGVQATIRAWRTFRAGLGPDPSAGRHRGSRPGQLEDQRTSRGRAR